MDRLKLWISHYLIVFPIKGLLFSDFGFFALLNPLHFIDRKFSQKGIVVVAQLAEQSVSNSFIGIILKLTYLL